MTSPATASTTGARPQESAPRRQVPKIVFLTVLLVVFVLYTQQGFGMEWRTQAGRIGPGYFPRIVGVTAIALILLLLAREVRGVREKPSIVDEAEQATEPDLGQHPLALAAFVAAAAAFVWLFGLIGTLLSGVLFLGVTLWFLDPGHRVRAVVLAVGVPVALYAAFELGLDVGLPTGVLLGG